MVKLILGIDAGNYEGKTAGPFGVDAWHTNISGYKERKVSEKFGDDDMEFVVNGRKGLAGSVAKYESRFGSKSMYGASKAHWYTEVRVLLSVYRYALKYGVKASEVSIVIGQPYAGHTEENKRIMKALLQREHNVEVNGNHMRITIEEVGIAPEGVGAFFSSGRKYPRCKVLDCGSGTINAIAFEDYRVTNYNSDTFNYGTEVMPMEEIAEGIVQDTTALGWTREDIVLVCGGKAKEMTHLIGEHYGKVETLTPTLMSQAHAPKYANAIGFYELAKKAFR